MKKLLLSVCLCLCGTGVASAGTFNYFGAHASYDGMSFPPQPFYNSDGGFDEVSATTDSKTLETSSSFNESLFSQSSLLAGDGTPELKAYAASSVAFRDLNVRASASASGLQSYIYNGSGGTLQMTANFHGSFLENNQLGLTVSQPEANIEGVAGLILLSEFESMEFDLSPHFFLGAPSGLPTGFKSGSVDGSAGLGEQTFSLNLSLDLSDGDEFIVYGGLVANSFGLIADASNTGTFSFSGSAAANISVLGNTVAPVPVPAAVWLMGSALVGLVGFRRKKQPA